jgi:hypothetical protein
MGIEMMSGLAMVVLMMGTVLIKYISTVMLVRNRKHLLRSEAELREVRSRLKAVQNEASVAKKNEKSFSNKKDRLEKQLPILQKELDGLSK